MENTAAEEKGRLDSLWGRNSLFWLSRHMDHPLLPPDFVQVNFTFRCNLKCKMCDMSAQMDLNKREGKQYEIDTDLCKKIIRDTKELGTQSIIFLGGEPFVREDLFELTSYARSFDLNPILVTNGVLLHEKNIQNCFEAGVNWLSVSIDAASDEVFSRIRGQNIFNTIVGNIRTLNRMKKEAQREFPKVVAVCTVMNDNLEELLRVVDLCKSLDVTKVFFQPVVACNVDQTQRRDRFPGFVPVERLAVLDKAIDALVELKRSSPYYYSFIGNSIMRLELMKGYFRGVVDPDKVPCYAGYNRLQIIQEGKAYFCVNQEQHEAVFGDIRRESLKSLWYSKKANQYRRIIKQCRAPCLQLCSQRDEFLELAEYFQKKDLFGEMRGA